MAHFQKITTEVWEFGSQSDVNVSDRAPVFEAQNKNNFLICSFVNLNVCSETLDNSY